MGHGHVQGSAVGAFVAALCVRLRQLPELQHAEDALLHQAAYCFCKAVSVDYVLFEVLQLVRQRTGAACMVETRGGETCGPMEYAADLWRGKAGQHMRVSLVWQGTGNIVSCEPGATEKTPVGTLSKLEACFELPPDRTSAPVYSVQMQLKRRKLLHERLRELSPARLVRASAAGRVGLGETVTAHEPLLPPDSDAEEYAASANTFTKLVSGVDGSAPSRGCVAECGIPRDQLVATWPMCGARRGSCLGAPRSRCAPRSPRRWSISTLLRRAATPTRAVPRAASPCRAREGPAQAWS